MEQKISPRIGSPKYQETGAIESSNSTSLNKDEELQSTVALRSPDPYSARKRKVSTATHSRIARTILSSSKALQSLSLQDDSSLNSCSVPKEIMSVSAKCENDQEKDESIEESEENTSLNIRQQVDGCQDTNSLNLPLSTESEEINAQIKAEIDQLCQWVEVDLPEMLNQYRNEIKGELLKVFCSEKVKFSVGKYKIVFHYTPTKYSSKPEIIVALLNDYYLYEGCTKDLPLADQIERYLSPWNIEKFKKNSTEVYYRVRKIDAVDSVGIPEEVFKRISYHSPVLSLSYFPYSWRYLILLGLFTSLIFFIPAYAYIDSLADINTAVSKLPVALTMIFIVIKVVQGSFIDRKYERK